MSGAEGGQYKGVPISSGKVVAPVCLYSAASHRVVIGRTLSTRQEIEEEIGRFEAALDGCSRELDKIASEVREKVGAAEAEIYVAQKHILNDPGVLEAIRKGVTEQKRNVEVVIDEVYTGYEDRFSALDNEYLRERSTDIGEIRRRLLDRLHHTHPGFVCQGQNKCSRGKDRVIVAEELTAEMMARMKFERVLGIVTERGGTTSHAAIIARSLGVPAVIGVAGIFEAVKCGTKVLVDGDEGVVHVEPDEDTVRRALPAEPTGAVGEICPMVSPPGVEVMANASLIEDVRQAAHVRADGIGLYRTEIQFLRSERLLTEDEQFGLYSEVVRLMGDRPVTFRLLDIGGDKELPFLRIGKEANPFLGWRGARFLLGSPEVFTAQVRALVRLSTRGRVRILIPMVVDAQQYSRLVQAISDVIAVTEARAESIMVGAMFEVPSAFLDADAILAKADFGSIGSNDLIQYLFAVDRSNELVSYDYNPDHPVLWSVLQDLSRRARAAGKPLSICGEMAGRQNTASRLVDIGIASLSVSPRLVPRVRSEVARREALSFAKD